VDSVGNLYFSSNVGSQVCKISNGVISAVAGNGNYIFSGDNGPATSAGMSPYGIALDSAGNLYIADVNNNRIRKVSNGIVTTVAGNGTEGFSGDGGTATSAELNVPYGVALDSAGNLYIADGNNNRVRKVTNGIITTVAGNGTEEYSGDNGPAISAGIYVPLSVALDSSGGLYISDSGHDQVRKVSNGIITTIAGIGGLQGFSGDGGAGNNAQLSNPAGIALDSAGRVYIAEDQRIRLLTPNAAATTSTSLVATPNPAASSQNVVLTATVAPAATTGTVTFQDTFSGTTSSLGTANLIAGTAVMNVSTLALGVHMLTAIYSGDPNFESSSGTYTLTVNLTNYAISGTITSSGAGLTGVTLIVSGTQTASTITDSVSGLYSIGGLGAGGSYTIAPFLMGYTFTPASQTFSNFNSNQTVNFTATLTPGLDFYPVTPCRIVDTRNGTGFSGQFGPPSMGQGATRTFSMLSSPCAAGIPATASAYSLNFTVVPPAGGPAANLTTWPVGLATGMPNVSNLNYYGNVVANAAIVPSGANGAIDVYASYPTDMLIDIDGYFAPPLSNGLEFYPVTPCRITDTRNGAGFNGQFGPPALSGQQTRVFSILSSACATGIPATVAAYSLNFTAVPPVQGPEANLTTWPVGLATGIPNVSTLNYYGNIAANAAIVLAGTNGAIDVSVSYPTNLLFDINGYFAPTLPSGLHFFPVAPCRVADTRNGTGFSGQFGPPSMGQGATRTFSILSSPCGAGIPATASAYSLNFTVVPPAGGPAANLTTWPVGLAMPNVSTLNYYGSVVAGSAVVPAGTNGEINVFVSYPTDVLFDINGYFAP
jgi:sugar lactone lactonase YvrE